MKKSFENNLPKKYRYEVGYIENDIEIIEQVIVKTKNGNRKGYKIKCHKCGFDSSMNYFLKGKIRENYITYEYDEKNFNCPCCGVSGKIVVKGINDIATTNPEVIRFLVNEEESFLYSKGSHHEVYVKCPYCGEIKEQPIQIDRLCKTNSIGCNCGKKNKYPERLMKSVLDKFDINLITQLNKKHFSWCENKRYDFYFKLNEEEYIIETHGGQHYKTAWKELKETQKNDKYKYELAIQNGINPENYIVIDCRYSNFNYIKNNIENSVLKQIFDLDTICWEDIQQQIETNMVKEVCEYYNKNDLKGTTKDLLQHFNISKEVAIDYLKKGNEVGWCIYNSKMAMQENAQKTGKLNGKKTQVFSLKGELLFEYASVSELCRHSEEDLGIKLNPSCVRKACIDNRKEYHGYRFKYKK